MPEPVLTVRDLRVHFYGKRGEGRAVDGVSFDLRRGEVVGLVGESGCGKSVTCAAILRLNPAHVSAIVGGTVMFNGEDILNMSEPQLRRVRGRQVGLILQDASSALNPVYSIGWQLFEPLRLHKALSGRKLIERAAALLRRVRIPGPKARLRSYPHQLSGGMQQRVVGAIATAPEPGILIADEPTTALDVTTQASYLAMLKRLQREGDLSMLLVTHDFTIVATICDRAAVMYAGRIVEMGPTQQLLSAPAHPYTEALLRSRPSIEHRVERLPMIQGQPPSIYDMPPGCPFAARCAYVMERCRVEYPPQRSVGPDHVVDCWRYVTSE